MKLDPATAAKLETLYRRGETGTRTALICKISAGTAYDYFLRFRVAGIPRRRVSRQGRKYNTLPVYSGPDWIGHPLTAPPLPVGPGWIGQRAVASFVNRPAR